MGFNPNRNIGKEILEAVQDIKDGKGQRKIIVIDSFDEMKKKKPQPQERKAALFRIKFPVHNLIECIGTLLRKQL